MRYKTGEKCITSGVYKFDGHTDGSMECHPTSDEKEIPLSEGETFPPIRSCKKGAYWVLIRTA